MINPLEKIKTVPKTWLNIMNNLLDVILDGTINYTAPRKATKAQIDKFSNYFFNLSAVAWFAGESESVNTIAKAIKTGKIPSTPIFDPSIIKQPATVARKQLDATFKRKGYPTINKKVYAKMMQEAKGKVIKSYTEIQDTTQRALKQFMDAKISPSEAKKMIRSTGVSQGYAQNVFRTNTSTAYNNGKYQRSVESELIDGFRYVSNLDKRTRPNHQACRGLEQPISSSWWDYLYPPLGFQCRCTVIPVMAGQLKPKIPSGLSFPPVKGKSKGFPDYPSFGRRPMVVK